MTRLRKWQDLSLRTKCLLLVSFPAAATIVMAGASYLAGTQTAAVGQKLDTSLRIGADIERLRTNEIETSADMRAYLITAYEPFVNKARSALAAFDTALQELSDLAADDPAQQRRLAQATALERLRVERIFGDTARFRSASDLPPGQIATAVIAAESERMGLERILTAMEAANTRTASAYLGLVAASRARQNAISAMCLMLGVMGGVGMSLLFARGITNRIAELRRNVARLASEAIVDQHPGADEIGALNDGLVQIERVLRQRRAVLENALHGIADVDLQGRYRWWNRAYAQIAGVSESYRPPTIQASVPAEERPRIQEAIRGMHLGGRAEIAARIEPPSGPVEVEITFLQNGPPEAGFYIFLREIGSAKVADRALIRAKDAAVASNRAKTDFLAKISHDIRTPLNAILGAADLLSQTSLTFDQSGYVHMFQRNCRRLVALINDFLDFSQIEAGAIHIEKAPFQIREIVDDALATFHEAAAKKAIVLGVDIDPEAPEWLLGDSLRIQQVLVNLLSNALKFTSVGRVDVRVKALEPGRSDGQRLRCEVSDTGPGIGPEDQEKIFVKFTQLPNQTASQRGTGLGLTICRDLVELMGGEIGISSRAGGGSTFHFTLPLEAAPLESEHAGAPAIPEVRSRAPEPAKLVPAAAVRILVAEDNEDNRLLLGHYLRSEPVKLRFAFTGQEALDAVNGGEQFDLILMDIDMPVLNGHGAARAIRAWEESHGGSTPIVALSADAMSEAVRSSLDAGCVAHVAKPVDRATLLKTIQRYARLPGAYPIQTSSPTEAVSEAVQALVPQYLEAKHKQIEEARDALISGNFGPIRSFGHNLKGTGRGYGFPAIEELGQGIEKAAVEADVDSIAEQLDALHRFVTQSAAAIANPVS